jgi:hypothetical protein
MIMFMYYLINYYFIDYQVCDLFVKLFVNYEVILNDP